MRSAPARQGRLKRLTVGLIAAFAGSLVISISARADVLKDAGTVAGDIVRDMTLPAETLPAGAPGWAIRPRINYGNDPRGFTGFTPWGQLYNCATGNAQPTARVQLADLHAYIMSKATGLWIPIRSDNPVGGYLYREDFAENQHVDANDAVVEGPSTTTDVPAGTTYHFVPRSARVAINPADVGGVLVVMRARLRPYSFDYTTTPPCLTLSVGADYWRTPTADWDGTNNNDDVGIGRFKRVTYAWRLFSMTTMSQAKLLSAPAPFTLLASTITN